MNSDVQNLFIPEKLNVGFKKREGTFDGNLAYIIYYDEKGKLRKEQSWDTWRDKKITALALDNKPQKGLIINKGIKRHGYHFGSGRSMARIYDPRGFEFEVSVDNLIGIINQSNIDLSEIVEECVYAWAGTELILLPTNSEQYKSALIHTENKNSKISLKDLKVGQTYSLKNSESLHVYIGHYEINNFLNTDYNKIKAYINSSKAKKHVFYSLEEKKYIDLSSSNLGRCIDREKYDETDILINNFVNSYMNKRIKGFEVFNNYTVEDLVNNKFGDSKKLIFVKEIENDRKIYEFVFREEIMKRYSSGTVNYGLHIDRLFLNKDSFINSKKIKNITSKEKQIIDYSRLVYNDGMPYKDFSICNNDQRKRDMKITDFEEFKKDMYILQYKCWKHELNLGILQVIFEDGSKEFVNVENDI